MQCRAHRGDGQSFVADVWFSTYKEGAKHPSWPPSSLMSPKSGAALQSRPSATSAGSERLPLNSRESDVLRLLVQGLANKEIAARLETFQRV